ncbi:MBL fold metallo-hydrolase [Nitrosopumilus sp.]|uniref:MBL fold metallo-hydrolase n=1 Tax=Nitrosopumilus sp. TaxID=2024843 RepID=UPI00292FF97F|nr:MBL fold metallo-hydrolase [Nitrosopumilus sp.]
MVYAKNTDIMTKKSKSSILLIGIFTILLISSIYVAQDAEAAKSKGTSLPETGSKKVCGDRLCSEITKEQGDSSAETETETQQQQETESTEEETTAQSFTVNNFVGNLYLFTEAGYNSMFIPTGEGVVVFDAPDSSGSNLVDAIADITDEPITHVVYSHGHKDHIGAAHYFPDDAVIIAQEQTKTWLEKSADPDRPIPTVVFSDDYTLESGNTVVELSYKGPVHSNGNIFFYIPEYKTLFLVDHAHPGWVPWWSLGGSTDVRAYIDGHDWILDYDFDYFVPGHGEIGDRDDVLLIQEYVLDLKGKAMTAIQTIDFAEATKGVSSEGYNMTDAYFEALADKCAQLSDDEWRDKLIGTDTWTETSCMKMIMSIFGD